MNPALMSNVYDKTAVCTFFNAQRAKAVLLMGAHHKGNQPTEVTCVTLRHDSCTLFLVKPYPSPPTVSNALKNMYSNRDEAIPSPSKIWPVKFNVALNVVDPEFS